jgi:hypothetical protein
MGRSDHTQCPREASHLPAWHPPPPAHTSPHPSAHSPDTPSTNGTLPGLANASSQEIQPPTGPCLGRAAPGVTELRQWRPLRMEQLCALSKKPTAPRRPMGPWCRQEKRIRTARHDCAPSTACKLWRCSPFETLTRPSYESPTEGGPALALLRHRLNPPPLRSRTLGKNRLIHPRTPRSQCPALPPAAL